MKERNKEVYLSSAWFTSHWSWDKLKAFYKSMIDGNKYFLAGLPTNSPLKRIY